MPEKKKKMPDDALLPKETAELFRDELKLFQDAYLRERILGSRELPEEKIRKRMQHLGIGLHGPNYCVTIFAPYLMERNADEIDELLMKILKRVRDGYRRAGVECYTISDGYCNAIAILSFQESTNNRTIEKVTQELADQLIAAHRVDLFAGIGDTVHRLSDISRSHNSAGEALAYKFTFSQNHVINAKDIERYYNPGARDLKLHYDWILGCFLDGDMKRMEFRLHNLHLAVCTGEDNDLDRLRNIYIELTASVLRHAYEMGLQDVDERDGVYTRIARMQAMEEIKSWFLSFCTGLLQKIANLRQDKNRQIVKLAEVYIEANIGDHDLTIQSISDHVDLSPAYFSGIFFKETGVHVSEYINRIRVECAKRMLLTTNDKVVTVSEKLGFSSANYFNNLFKRYTGTTPKKYRESSG